MPLYPMAWPQRVEADQVVKHCFRPMHWHQTHAVLDVFAVDDPCAG